MQVRNAVHMMLVLSAGPAWVVAYFALAIAAGLVKLADMVWPDATSGNCWSFAGPKWLRDGGYLSLRKVPEATLFGIFPVIHVVWVREMAPNTTLEMTRPLRRRYTRGAPKWMFWKHIPWWTFYFKFRIAYRDQPMGVEDVLRRRRIGERPAQD